jgi:hypothetical protein
VRAPLPPPPPPPPAPPPPWAPEPRSWLPEPPPPPPPTSAAAAAAAASPSTEQSGTTTPQQTGARLPPCAALDALLVRWRAIVDRRGLLPIIAATRRHIRARHDGLEAQLRRRTAQADAHRARYQAATAADTAALLELRGVAPGAAQTAAACARKHRIAAADAALADAVRRAERLRVKQFAMHAYKRACESALTLEIQKTFEPRERRLLEKRGAIAAECAAAQAAEARRIHEKRCTRVVDACGRHQKACAAHGRVRIALERKTWGTFYGEWRTAREAVVVCETHLVAQLPAPTDPQVLLLQVELHALHTCGKHAAMTFDEYLKLYRRRLAFLFVGAYLDCLEQWGAYARSATPRPSVGAASDTR